MGGRGGNHTRRGPADLPSWPLLLQQRAADAVSNRIVAHVVLDVVAITAQATWGQAAAVVGGVLGRTRHTVQSRLDVEDALGVRADIGTGSDKNGSRLVGGRAGGGALDQDDQDLLDQDFLGYFCFRINYSVRESKPLKLNA